MTRSAASTSKSIPRAGRCPSWYRPASCLALSCHLLSRILSYVHTRLRREGGDPRMVRPKEVQISAIVPEALRQRLQHAAIDIRKTQSEIVSEALTRWLD